MAILHKTLAAGRWERMPFVEQMAHIGSEVNRALSWRKKNNEAYCRQAVERALELLDLTLASARGFPRLKELTRTRESLVDYFFGNDEYGSTDTALANYFFAFNCASRKRS